MTSLNPVFTVGDQIAEVLEIHRGLSRARRAGPGRGAARSRRPARPPREQLDRYPHQLSGGQRQRVMIAMALACEPRAAHRRRADDGARRDRAGADPGADRPAAARPRHGLPAHHARPRRRRRGLRPGGGDVCRAHRRGGDRSASCSPRRATATRARSSTRCPRCNPPGALLPSITGMVPPPGRARHGLRLRAALLRAGGDRAAPSARRSTGDAGHRAACWNPAA